MGVSPHIYTITKKHKNCIFFCNPHGGVSHKLVHTRLVGSPTARKHVCGTVSQLAVVTYAGAMAKNKRPGGGMDFVCKVHTHVN